MRRFVTARWFLCAALVVVGGLTRPTMSADQSPTLIHACVDGKGAIRIVSSGTTCSANCSAKETRLTWPAAPAEPVTFYERVSASQPLMDATFTTVVALWGFPEYWSKKQRSFADDCIC
jgi:hypothetical protein